MTIPAWLDTNPPPRSPLNRQQRQDLLAPPQLGPRGVVQARMEEAGKLTVLLIPRILGFLVAERLAWWWRGSLFVGWDEVIIGQISLHMDTVGHILASFLASDFYDYVYEYEIILWNSLGYRRNSYHQVTLYEGEERLPRTAARLDMWRHPNTCTRLFLGT